MKRRATLFVGAAALALAATTIALGGPRIARLMSAPADPQPFAEAERLPPRESEESAMILGAVSNFSQGWNEETLAHALDLPVQHFRDGIRWQDIEKEPGRFEFRNAKALYPGRLEERGGRLTLVVNWGNPLYDAGGTPHSPAALAAFGRFVAELVQRYPAIEAVEVGNEFNSGNFVRGRVKEAGLAERGRYHLAMVRSAAEAVKAIRPEVKVLGGATHSIPAGYLWPMLESDGAAYLEGLAIHPYTTPVDQLASQVGVLRRHPAARRLPLFITEFGTSDEQLAADHLVRSFAALASLNTAAAYWYPLNERGDDMVPLISPDGSPTNAGRAFRFVQSFLAGRRAQDISPDRFTFVHAFGPNIIVAWGERRPLSLRRADIRAYDATGQRSEAGSLQLQPNRALILVGDRPIDLGRDLVLGCTPLIADSFYQFDYPGEAEEAAPGSGFQRLARRSNEELQLEILPGQQQPNVPWNPYLGLEDTPRLRVTATDLIPAGGGAASAIIHRYVADKDRRIGWNAAMEVSERTDDGVTLTVSLNGRAVFTRAVMGGAGLEQEVDLARGDTLDFAVSPNDNARGDATEFRLRLLDARKCQPAARPR